MPTLPSPSPARAQAPSSPYARHADVDTALGEVTLVASDDALVGLYFPHHWYLPDRKSFGPAAPGDAVLEAARAQLDEYLAGKRTAFDLTTATHGDPFQEQVWSLLKEIPFGETTTYGELAVRLGDKSLAQTVGRAVGRNPLSIVVACHRVVGRNGELTGYAGGLPRKRHLLDLEATVSGRLARLF